MILEVYIVVLEKF